MTEQKTGRGSASTPFDFDELLGPTPKKDYFKANKKAGEKVERRVRTLFAEYGVHCYGTEPGVHDDGSAPNNAKEQKDIVVHRNRQEDSFRVIEVKSRRTLEYPTLMLEVSETWKQKEIEPTAVILVQQNAPHDILVAHIPTVRDALKRVLRRVWDIATQRYRYKVNIEVPKSLCWSWPEFIERFLKWHQEPSAIESWQDDGEHEGVYEDLLLQIVSNGTPLLNNNWATSPSK
jgi:Holliday junction resolvase-like predicted endonuclease